MINLLNLTHDIESSQTKTVLTSVVKISCPLKRYELSIVGFDWAIPQRPMQPEGSLSFFLPKDRAPSVWMMLNEPSRCFTFQGPILHAKIWFYSRNHAAFVVLHSDGKSCWVITDKHHIPYKSMVWYTWKPTWMVDVYDGFDVGKDTGPIDAEGIWLNTYRYQFFRVKDSGCPTNPCQNFHLHLVIKSFRYLKWRVSCTL